MGNEMLYYVLLEIAVLLCFALFLRQTGTSMHKQSEANERAEELLRSVLTSEQYDQLTRNGYLDIKSPSDPECIYRVPAGQGLVKVMKQGLHRANLCLQPQQVLPGADIGVMHKLMIEAGEETYLQTANLFTPKTCDTSLIRWVRGTW